MFTKEEIRELFAESNKAIAELAKTQKKTEQSIYRLAARQEKTEQSIDKAISELKEEIAKTSAEVTKTTATVREVSRMCGGLGNNVGKAAEEFFFNTLEANPVLKEIQFGPPQKNWHGAAHNRRDEFDIVMLNGSAIFILEVKFNVEKEDVEKLLTTKKENFNIIYPEYKDYDQHWGLATFIIEDDLRDMAVENGLTVLQRKGDLIESYNP